MTEQTPTGSQSRSQKIGTLMWERLCPRRRLKRTLRPCDLFTMISHDHGWEILKVPVENGRAVAAFRLPRRDRRTCGRNRARSLGYAIMPSNSR